MVYVHDLPDGRERAPMLSEVEASLMDSVEAKWGELCRAHGKGRSVPDGWLQAMIFRESGGKETAFLREPNGWTGVGLFQITHPALKGAKKIEGVWYGGLTDAQLFVPATNVAIAAKYVQELRSKYGNDFPRVAAAFNAGSARPPGDAAHENPWWLHSTGNHITVEVSALNYWISKYSGKTAEETPPFISLIDLAREADDLARRDTEPPDDTAA